MEKVISKVVALGIPGLILLTAISAANAAGGAAIMMALASLGPFGVLGGIATLGVISIISQGITEFGFEAIFSGVIKEFIKKGEDKNSIIKKIKKYPVSKSLKLKLIDKVSKYDEKMQTV